jgi:putative transposase
MDITYILTREGWLNLTVVLDLFSRLVNAWSMVSRIDTELALYALLMSLWHRQPKETLLVHQITAVNSQAMTGWDSCETTIWSGS